MKEKSLGRHILVELYNCAEEKLRDTTYIKGIMIKAAEKSNATIVNSTFHRFSPFGVSGFIIIKESHLSIHTWPEYKYAAIDIFTCGESINPWLAFDYLKHKLQAGSISVIDILRGDKSFIPELSTSLEYSSEYNIHSKSLLKSNHWFTERHDNTSYSLRCKEDVLFKKISKYQKVEVYDTFEYGKMLTLDDVIMTTEKDEFIYHEIISHVPLIAHINPKNILVIGGGDGGVATQCLKHGSIETITIVEIDNDVIEASKKYLSSISSSFKDERVKVVVDDAVEYVKNLKDETYDTIIIDSTDPRGPSLGIFTIEFYKNIHRILKSDGTLALQSESPWYNSSVFRDTYLELSKIFKTVFPFLASIPTYPSGLWGFCFCAKNTVNPMEDYDYEYSKEFSDNNHLLYYNEEIHRASFILPEYIKKIFR